MLALRVRLLQRAGQQEAALEMAHKASALAPTWDEPFYLAGISQYLLRHYADARQNLTRAFELNPRSATAIFMAALASGGEGEPRQAERYLRRAIALQPDNARFHCHLGILLMRLNEYSKAEESLKRAANSSQNTRSHTTNWESWRYTRSDGPPPAKRLSRPSRLMRDSLPLTTS